MIRRFIKRFPEITFLYRFGRRAISVLNGWSDRKKAITSLRGRVVRLSGYRNVFAGYYDHSPFCPEDDSLLLVHATRHPAWKRPSATVPVSILLIDWRRSAVVRELGKTFSWNWQQGARALWVGQDKVIYNFYDSASKSYRARLVRTDGFIEDELPIPVQDYSQVGFVYGISYEALHKIRPDYGYSNPPSKNHDLNNNGIESYELSTGLTRTLVSIQELVVDAKKRHGFEVTSAKLNHVMASPCGSILVFLLRYHVQGRRVTDLYKLDVDTCENVCLVADSGVSHACWRDAMTLLLTMNGAQGFGYYLVNVMTSVASCVMLTGDGHPGVLDGDHFITDTYPDSLGLRRLLVSSYQEGGQNFEVSAFPEPLLFQGETRCDLHPSVSSSGQFIQVDCAVSHRRHVLVLPNPLAD